jgi:hypothetical protein
MNESFTNWDGNILDLGPLYPFVGSEVLMVILLVVLWVGWHLAQLVGENRDLDERVQQFRRQDALQRALDEEHPIERM